MLPLQLVDWFASIEPRASAELGFGVVVWGRLLADDLRESKRVLSAYAMEQRLGDSTFSLQDGRLVQLVGESDEERAALAGVPKPFVEAFKHGIPPAYEMLVGIAPSILSTAPPQSPLILPGTSLPPSPARAPSLSFSATHDHLLPDTLDSDDELLPPSLFDLGTGFSRKDGAICTRKELYESFVRPKRPTEDALELEVLPGAFTPDRDEGYDEDADDEAEQGAQADSKYRPPTPPGSNALLDATDPLAGTNSVDEITSSASLSLVLPALDAARPANDIDNSAPAGPRPTPALPAVESSSQPSDEVDEPTPEDVEMEIKGPAEPVESPIVDATTVAREFTPPPPTLGPSVPQTPASQPPASYLTPTRSTPTHSHSRPTTPASLRRLRLGVPSPSPDQPRSSLGSIADLYQESEADSADGYMRDVVDFVERDTAGLGSESEINETYEEMEVEEMEVGMDGERAREVSLAPTERDEPTPEAERVHQLELSRLQSSDEPVDGPVTELVELELERPHVEARPSSVSPPPTDRALAEPQLADGQVPVEEPSNPVEEPVEAPLESPLALVAAEDAPRPTHPSPRETTALPLPPSPTPIQTDSALVEEPSLNSPSSQPPIEQVIEPPVEAAELALQVIIAVETPQPDEAQSEAAPQVETPQPDDDDEMLEPPPEPELANDEPAAEPTVEVSQGDSAPPLEDEQLDSPTAAVEPPRPAGAPAARMDEFDDSPNDFGGGDEGELVAPEDTAGLLPGRSDVAAEALIRITGARPRSPSSIPTPSPPRRSPPAKMSRPFVEVVVSRRPKLPAARSSSQDDLALQPAPPPAKTGPFSSAPSSHRFRGPSSQPRSGTAARKSLVSVEVPVCRPRWTVDAQPVASTSKLAQPPRAPSADPFAAPAPAPVRRHRSPLKYAAARVPSVAAIPPSVFFASVPGDDETPTHRRRKGKARALPSPSPEPEPEPEPAIEVDNAPTDDERTSIAPPSPPPAARKRPAPSKPLPSRKLARKGAPTTASTPLVATAAFARRSRQSVAASSPVQPARSREDSTTPGTGDRPARARKSAAGWWELPKALNSLKTFKRPLEIEPKVEDAPAPASEAEEPEEEVVVRPTKRARKSQDVAPKRQTASEPRKVKPKVHQSQPTSLSNAKVPTRFRGGTQWEGMTEVVARVAGWGDGR